ncbi:MAG TPA: DUF2249 domain-containing protein [Verrucomicrobiae bacterium]|nr:DUF2249 domain-containing protein [Verrucomicrobiae bacterium]
MKQKIVVIDVREEIRTGREPFAIIMGAVARVKPDVDLLLIAPFEPKPLFPVLASQGFKNSAREVEDGCWEVLFSRAEAKQPAAKPPDETLSSTRKPAASLNAGKSLPGDAPPSAPAIMQVDVRGLEPPQPLVRILEALESLPAGAELRAKTDRRPVHLHTHLDARGFTGESEEQSDGSVVTIIRRQ